MRLFSRSAFIFILFTTVTSMVSVKSKTTRVVFFGDSITEAGAKPGGYIVKMKDALTQKGLRSQYDLVAAGIGGNKAYDLYLRMGDDVLALNPDVVFIFVGVSDVSHNPSFGPGTDPAKFEKFYTAIITQVLDKHIPLLLSN